MPRESAPDSGQFRIFEYYETEHLQTLLKLDFYKGLEAGHLIRKCELCGRLFLLQKGYHTKYCDSPNPDNPRYSCAQLGYRTRGVKETAADRRKNFITKRERSPVCPMKPSTNPWQPGICIRSAVYSAKASP